MKIPPKSINKVNRDFLIMERRSVFNPCNLGFYDKYMRQNSGAVDHHAEHDYFRCQNS